MRLIDADKAIEDIGDNIYTGSKIRRWLKSLPSAQPEPEPISKWKKEFREYVDSLDITRDDWKGIIEYIDELPSAEPDTTTHDSIPAETGKNDGDRTSGDCISRTQAIDWIHGDADWLAAQGSDWQTERMERDKSILMSLPSIQPELKELSEWKADFKGYINALNMPKDDYDGIMEYIDELPSAQPETNCSEIPNNWIPCRERLPEEGEVVLTQAKFKDDVKMAVSSRIDYNYWTGWGTRDINIIAWMPLPEPARLEND